MIVLDRLFCSYLGVTQVVPGFGRGFCPIALRDSCSTIALRLFSGGRRSITLGQGLPGRLQANRREAQCVLVLVAATRYHTYRPDYIHHYTDLAGDALVQSPLSFSRPGT